MKASSLTAFASALLLASCGPWGETRKPHSRQPVLDSLTQAETASRIDFARHVRPILTKRCVWCHQENEIGKLYLLTSKEEAFHKQRIIPGKPAQSPFYLATTGQHPQLKEYPKGVQIAKSDRKVLERWILSGAVWPAGQAGQL